MEKCNQCHSPFEVTKDDLSFLEQISPVFNGKKELVSPPTLCPECRHQRRMAWRNERFIYRRKCDKSGKEIVSTISPDKPYKVYDLGIWWSDQWDAMDYGRDFENSKSFFDQFGELILSVPRMSLINSNTVNCDYANYISDCKDCYLTFVAYLKSENAHYSSWVWNVRDSIDLFDCMDAELSYECVKCDKVYRCLYCFRCFNSDHCLFSSQLRGCSHCLFCSNLVNKKYHINNKPYSKEEYEKKLAEIKMGDASKLREYLRQYEDLMARQIVKNLNLVNCENCLGDDLVHCKNAEQCYDSRDLSDSKYFWGGGQGHHMVDAMGGFSEWIYEAQQTGVGGGNCLFASSVLGSSNMAYCETCFNCHDCFGCVGLRNKQYCVLNRQYSKEEYESLVPKIIAQMRKAGEWGEFFPGALSTFGYNETAAALYFVLAKEQALAKGFKWSDYIPPKIEAKRFIKAERLPDDIKDIPDDILNWGIECEVTGKHFKVIKSELEFYRKMNLPVPRRHPDQRHEDRFRMRNPRHLWDRNCANCKKPIQTTYSPDRPETVYCEQCYLREVY